jgi:hypothetical protein
VRLKRVENGLELRLTGQVALRLRPNCASKALTCEFETVRIGYRTPLSRPAVGEFEEFDEKEITS